MLGVARYTKGAALGDLECEWLDSRGNPVLFGSVEYVFELKVGVKGKAALLTKTAGFVGDDELPNVVVLWDATEFDDVPPGTYAGQIKATRDPDNKARFFKFQLVLDEAIS